MALVQTGSKHTCWILIFSLSKYINDFHLLINVSLRVSIRFHKDLGDHFQQKVTLNSNFDFCRFLLATFKSRRTQVFIWKRPRIYPKGQNFFVEGFQKYSINAFYLKPTNQEKSAIKFIQIIQYKSNHCFVRI